jgi:hypothetical protein
MTDALSTCDIPSTRWGPRRSARSPHHPARTALHTRASRARGVAASRASAA